MFSEADALIEARIGSQLTTTEVEYDNVEFTPVIGTPYLRLQVEWTDTETKNVGGTLKRGTGYVMLSVFVSANTGTKESDDLADSAAAIFEKWQSGGLRFQVARKQRIGRKKEWYQTNVIIPFQYDKCT